MASGGEYTGSAMYPEPAQALEEESRRRFWRKLLVWSGFVAAGVVVVRTFVATGPWIAEQPVRLTGGVLGIGVGMAALIYCFTSFVLARELRYIMMAAAFGALAGGSALQALADLLFPKPALSDGILTASWLLASLLFAGSSFSHSALRTHSRLLRWTQSLVGGMLVVAMPLAMLPYALNVQALYDLVAASRHAMLFFVLETTVTVASIVLLLATVMGNYRRFVARDDRLSLMICLFLVPCVFGLMYRLASQDRFDEWWFYSHVLICGAWLVLAMGFTIESAFSHKDADDRLSELAVLHDVSWSLIGTQSIGTLLSTFIQMVREKTQAGIAAVYLADPEGRMLEVAALSGRDEHPVRLGMQYAAISEARWPGFHTGHTARAFTSKQLQIADDVFVDVELVPWQTIAVDSGRAVSLPLLDRGEAVGVLNLYYHQQNQCTPERLKLLRTIAASAGPAIAGARAAQQETESQEIDIAA